MLDMHRLRVFRAVVASGSIQAAAANLGYTPSAVSQQVAALQRETGLVLVARNGRGIEPTAAGLALAAQVDDLLERLGGVESLVGDLRAGRTGTLSIAYFSTVGSAWMPHVVRDLLAAFPAIRLSLSLRDDLATIDRPDLQLVVAQGPQSLVGGGLRVHHLLDEPYVAVVPADHPLATQSQVDLPALATERWIDNDFVRGWCRRNLIEACRAAGFSPPFHVEAHDYPSAIAFVDAGVGITVLPRLGAIRLPPGVALVEVVNPRPMRSIHAVVQTSVEDTAPVQTALAALRRVAGA